MPIDFACQACGQAYRVKDEFAGKTTKCRKCSQPVTVPAPAVPPPESDSELGSLLDEEFGTAQPVRPLASAEPATPCPSCNANMPAGATLCVHCGYDIATGKKRSTENADAPKGKKKKKSASGTGRSGVLLLARGILLSGIGALLGAIVWAFIAVMTHHEIGWIAWGVGLAAGTGMTLGYDDQSDGTIPGILAAFIALGGIVLGKIFIVVWLTATLLANADFGAEESIDFKLQLVAGRLADEALEKRGVNLETVSESDYDDEYSKALASVQEMEDAELDRVYSESLVRLAETPPSGAEMTEPGEQEALTGQAAPAVHIEVADAEPAPSLIGLFFSSMFGPMDALFILLAFFTAYKVGSGSVTG